MPANGQRTSPPRSQAGRPRHTRTAPAPMGQGNGEPATQNPCGLRLLPRPYPYRATSHTAHAVVTGEPDDRETIKSGSAGGRAEKDPLHGHLAARPTHLPGSANAAAASVTTRPCPSTTRPWSTLP